MDIIARTHRPRIVALAAVVAVAAVVVPSGARAQRYKSDPVDNQLRLIRGVAQKAVKDASAYAADKQRFDDYFQKYYFPSMTLTTPEGLGEIGDLRYDLLRQYLWPATSEALQRDLTAMAYEYMRGVAGDPGYHPAVRYNAVLLLGMLDEEYAIDSGANRRPPKPLESATKLLTRIVNLAGKNRLITPSMVVAALTGLERHARFKESLGRETLANMYTAALRIVTLSEPVGDVDPAIDHWMRAQAATVLAEIGQPGQDNQALTAILELAGREKVSLDDRARLVALLDKFPLEAASGIDGASVARQVVDVVAAICQNAADEGQEFQEMQLGGRGLGGRRGRPRPRSFNPADGPPQFERRQILTQLIHARQGLRAIQPLITPELKPKTDAVAAAVQRSIEMAEDKDTLDLPLVEQLQEASLVVNGVVTAWESSATAAGTTADVEDIEDEF